MSVEIRYVGEGEYRGFDPGNENADVVLASGQSTKVSDQKAKQLAEDAAHLFEIGGEPAADAPPAPAADVEDDVDPVVAELRKLNRDELNLRAQEAGVPDPATFRNKDELAQEIVRLAEES